MNILRSVNRRGFRVGTAGYFNILMPNTWFPASRLPGASAISWANPRTAVAQEHENPTENSTAAPPPDLTSAPEQNALDHAASQETAFLSQFIRTSTQGHRLLRFALIVLAATALAWILLWWIDFA
jgi:hypothetical protein